MMLVIECKVYSLDVQVASSEWVLAVQIKHFENPYNVKIRNDLNCCCDSSSIRMCGEGTTHVESVLAQISSIHVKHIF